MPSSLRRILLVVALLLPLPASAGGLLDRFGAPLWKAGGTQMNGQFGFSATAAGDVDGDGFGDVLVGAPLQDSTVADEGAAYLFRGSHQGSALTPAWVVHGRQLGAQAGLAVAPAGDVNKDGYADVLVAVPYWDAPSATDAGKVLVFHGGPGGLSSTPAYELFAPTPAAGEHFGISVAYAGDTNGDGYADVLVGSQLTQGGFTRGAVYLFEGGVGGLFTTPAKVWLGQAGVNAFLGQSVSTAGDVNADGFADVILGSPGENNGFTGNGTASVWLGSGSGIVAAADTVIKGSANGVACGRSVSVGGDVNGDGYSDVVIGVPGQNAGVGKAMIGFGGPQGITTVADVLNPENVPNESIGSVVSTVGDINGDGFADFGVVSNYTSGTNLGRISIYLGSLTGPQYFGEILTHGSGGFFGNSLASSGDTNGDGFTEILVGTESTDATPGQHEGVVYQFKKPRSGIKLANGGWPRDGVNPFTGYGSAVAVVSRFDAADAAKLVIGDPGNGTGGRVSIHGGSQTTGVNFDEERFYPAPGSALKYGSRIVDLGDIDGDSYSDFAVSAIGTNNGPATEAGAVLLHLGSGGIPPAPTTVVTGASTNDHVGSALAGRGDVNGDGYLDLLIGAREWDEPAKVDAGKVFLFFGSSTGLLTTPPWTRVGSVAGQGFGAGVALTDFDADGYTDVVVGSSSPTNGSTAPGKVEVYYGGPTGPSNTPGTVYAAPLPDDVSFGLTVAALGDVTGDGIADLGIGAPAEGGHGVVRVFEGSLGRSQSPFPVLTIPGTQADARFGEAMAGGGDVDGDGVDDFAIGEPGWDGSQTDEGRFSLYFGPLRGVTAVPGVVFESGALGSMLGSSIAPFRDINLDGFADVILGAPGDAGYVLPFMGGGGFGKRLEIQPYDYGVFNHRAVHPARSHDPDQVASAFFEHTAAQGRSRCGFEVEIKTSNQPFDGVATNLSGWDTFDSGPAGVQSFVFTTSFLSPELPGRTLKLRGRWTNPNPLFPRSRWITPEAHTSGDHDVWLTGSSVGAPPPGAPARLSIQSVAPNPALRQGTSLVSFSLPRAGRVTLDVYDLRGAHVRSLFAGAQPAGPASLAWDGRDDRGRTAATGVYVLVLRAGDELARTKVIRLP